MFKKGILFLIVLVVAAAFNTGFFDKKANLNFIKSPDIVAIMGNQHEAEIVELNAEYTKLQQTNASQDEQQKVLAELQSYSSDILQLNDKKFIDTVVTGIKNGEGIINENTIMKPKSGRIYNIQFGYNSALPTQTMADLVNNLKSGYIPNVYIFPNDTAVLPMYNEKEKTLVSTVLVHVGEDTIKYINDYYNARVK